MYKDEFGVSYSDDKKQLISCPLNFCGNYSIEQGTECIASNAFRYCQQITKLIIPSSVKTIMADAFKDISGLKALYFSGSLVEWMQINHEGFLNCPHDLWINDSLLNDVEIPPEITAIGKFVFYYCRSLRSVKFHGRIKSIGDSAFNKSTLSGSVNLPEGLETIGEYAFLSCSSITSVRIPASVTKVGNCSFLYCRSLERIDVDEHNIVYSSIDGVLFNKDKECLIMFPSHHGNFDIPAETKFIELNSFKGAKSADAITIANPKLSCNNTKLTFDGATIKKIFIPVGSKTAFARLGFPESKLIEKFSVESSIIGDGVIGLIRENPFRIIGVPSNASAKDISSRATKIKRYLEVGKAIESELDVVDLLGCVERSLDIMDKAYSSISLPQNRIKAALFWFFKGDDPTDEIAFNHIQAGNYDKVVDLYKSMNSPSSFINRGIIFFIRKNYQEGLAHIGRVLCVDKIREQFVKSVCGASVAFSEEELSKIFVDELSSKVRLGDLCVLFDEASPSSTACSYLKTKTINDSIDHIEDLIRVAQDTTDNDYEGLKNNGLELAASLADLETIKSICGANSAQFEEISDRLSVAIVNTGVRLAKLTDVSDRGALDIIAKKMLIKVLDIPYDVKVKSYCEEQYDAISNLLFRAPQKSYKEEDAIIREKVRKIMDYDRQDVGKLVDMVSECLPLLVSIKNKGGDYYLQVISEDIANLALSKSVPIVNKCRNDAGVVKNAIKLVKYLLALPVGDFFRKDRLMNNYNTLISNTPKGVDCHRIKIKYTVVGDQQELDMWNSCKTIGQYEAYLKKYPNGEYVIDAKHIIEDKTKRRLKIIIWSAVVIVAIVVLIIVGVIYGIETVWSILGILAVTVILGIVRFWISLDRW